MEPKEFAMQYIFESSDYAAGANNFLEDAERALKRGDVDKSAELLEQAKNGLEAAAYRLSRAQEYIQKLKFQPTRRSES